MKKINTLISAILILTVLSSCSEQIPTQKEEASRVQVKTTQITKGYLPDYISITGRTIYLNKNRIVAPIDGYVTKVNVQQGDKISKGKVLFEMQPPESYVMRQNNRSQKNYGLVNIYAPATGTITSLNVTQQGVYSDRGAELCLIVASGGLKVKAAVPFEMMKYVKTGKTCDILLPDSTHVKATFTKVLPQMNNEAQTIEVFADLSTKLFIPENLVVRIMVEKNKKHETQILPKSCLMTDALMTKFWVMKLINKDVAVVVPVKIGNQTHTQVEILSPKFNPHDRIISEGAYGLSDTTLVEIIK